MKLPEEFGLPCWSQDQVAKVITQAVEAKSQSAPHFLAAHSPFRLISDSTVKGKTVAEEDVFHNIFSPGRGEVQAFIKGEPGTGKSHLIRWLKLRSDYAAKSQESELSRFKLVLVERGTGSLKDALQRIVAQLGPEFGRHLDRVRGAIDKLSLKTARATLRGELALEIDQRWSVERGRDPLHKSLAHLGQALNAKGFGRWMEREGGTIDRVVRRLCEQGNPEEDFPTFAPSEFDVPDTHLRPGENSHEVMDFGKDLQEDDDRRKKAAEAMNVALADAIRELTGLRGSNLFEIFVDIRKELHKQDMDLAIFIEDVSVTGLDKDVVNAFEPRAGEGLCRMVAVLGITNMGWDAMPDNQRQRATHVYQVGDEMAKKWASDADEVARFTARYLNAARMSDSEVNAVAKERFSRDVRRSKCSDCSVREQCHAAFGKVELTGGVEIGMFPFTKQAPFALLERLNNVDYRSQRYLLVHVLLPALDQSYGAFSEHAFPNALNFNVKPRALTNWDGFKNSYCGGPRWDADAERRLKFLAQFWAASDRAEDLATELKPMLQPFGLPPFSQEPRPQPKPAQQPKTPEGAEPAGEDQELQKQLQLIDTWWNGKDLAQDGKFRGLLERLLKESIAWEEQREVPISEKRLVDDTATPHIEGQTAKHPSHKFFIEFKRNKDTHALLVALVHFERAKNSWEFEHGELHKRNVSSWLRKNHGAVVNAVKPKPSSLATAAVDCAAKALALEAMLRDRQPFDDNWVATLKRIFNPSWDGAAAPAVLSEEMSELVSDLPSKHDALARFLVQELGAGQGSVDPKDFINPLPILKAVESFRQQVGITPPPKAISESFWKPRFQTVSQLGAYGDLHDRLKKERRALLETMEEVKEFSGNCGIANKDVRQALKDALDQVVDLLELQKGRQAPLPYPNQPFDELWDRRVIQKERASWIAAFKAAEELRANDSLLDLLAFDPNGVRMLAEALTIIWRYLELLEGELVRQEEALNRRGAASSGELLKELDALAAMAEESK